MFVVYNAAVCVGIYVAGLFYRARDEFDRILVSLLRIIPAKVKPDHLSWSRVPLGIIVSFFLFVYPVRGIAIVIYNIAWFTDVLDGALARFRKQFSIWGRRIDPLADKLLNDTIFIGFVYTDNGELNSLRLWLWIIIVADALTTLTAGLIFYFFEIRVPANVFGKWKYGAQCAGCVPLIVSWISLAEPILELAALLGILSAVTYAYNAYLQLKACKV